MPAENENISPAVRVGIDYALKLSYTVIDKSDYANKRDLLYGLTCFGCMFDDVYAREPDPIVKKYDCLSAPEPSKPELYELAYATVSAANMSEETAAEIKKSWFMTFAYVLLSEAPHSPEIYEKMCGLLQNEKVYEDVLESRYSVYIPATEEELAAQGASTRLIEWYAPYLSYCTERDENGVTRETRECKRLLALGRFDESLLRGERLLAAFPDDAQVAITDIAARVSLSSAATPEQRTALLKDTLSLIDEYTGVTDSPYFGYYRGLTLLGLMDTVGARREFELCLERDASFELAALMLKGMDKYAK